MDHYDQPEMRAPEEDAYCNYDEDDFDEDEKAQWRAAMEMNCQLRSKISGQNLRRPQPKVKRRKDQAFHDAERLRIERENNHLVRHISDLGHRPPSFSINDRYNEDRHVAASYLQRKRNEYKISRENRLIANRLEHDGGNIRSSGYGRNTKAPCGPLAKRNYELAKRRFSIPRLQQPEMSF